MAFDSASGVARDWQIALSGEGAERRKAISNLGESWRLDLAAILCFLGDEAGSNRSGWRLEMQWNHRPFGQARDKFSQMNADGAEGLIERES
jgi:hypothetical protein